MGKKNGKNYSIPRGMWAKISVLDVSKPVKLGDKTRVSLSVTVVGKRVGPMLARLEGMGIDIADEKRWTATMYVNGADGSCKILSYVNGHWA